MKKKGSNRIILVNRFDPFFLGLSQTDCLVERLATA